MEKLKKQHTKELEKMKKTIKKLQSQQKLAKEAKKLKKEVEKLKSQNKVLTNKIKGKKKSKVAGKEFVINNKLLMKIFTRLAKCIAVIEMGSGWPNIWETDINYEKVEITKTGEKLLDNNLACMNTKFSDRFMELFEVEFQNILKVKQKELLTYRLMSFVAALMQSDFYLNDTEH